jgi:transcriptional regulator with XRE-family HTH domain
LQRYSFRAMQLTDLPMPERIREMRRRREFSGQGLAEAVGVSPSYISLIEKGMKIPQEDVAVRIAQILGDDEEAYRVWAASARMSDNARAAIWSQLPLQAQRRYQSGGRARRTAEPEPRVAEPAGKAACEVPGEAASAAASEAAGGAASEAVGGEASEALDEANPVVAAPARPLSRSTAFAKRRERWELSQDRPYASSDSALEDLKLEPPAAEHTERHLAQQLLMTAKDLLSRVRPATAAVVLLPLLPEGEPLPDGPLPAEHAEGHFPVRPDVAKRLGEDAVALQVTAENGARVPATFRPGDIVILDRRWSEPRPDAVFAVRFRGALVLSRCTLKGGSLLLLGEAGPGGAAVDVEILPAPDTAALRRLIAGRVALSVRAWA